MTYYCDRCLSEHESPDFVCTECEPQPGDVAYFLHGAATHPCLWLDGSLHHQPNCKHQETR